MCAQIPSSVVAKNWEFLVILTVKSVSVCPLHRCAVMTSLLSPVLSGQTLFLGWSDESGGRPCEGAIYRLASKRMRISRTFTSIDFYVWFLNLVVRRKFLL